MSKTERHPILNIRKEIPKPGYVLGDNRSSKKRRRRDGKREIQRQLEEFNNRKGDGNERETLLSTYSSR